MYLIPLYIAFVLSVVLTFCFSTRVNVSSDWCGLHCCWLLWCRSQTRVQLLLDPIFLELTDLTHTHPTSSDSSCTQSFLALHCSRQAPLTCQFSSSAPLFLALLCLRQTVSCVQYPLAPYFLALNSLRQTLLTCAVSACAPLSLSLHCLRQNPSNVPTFHFCVIILAPYFFKKIYLTCSTSSCAPLRLAL